MPNRILIVDDEPLNLDLLDQELAEMGHVTERAIDGSEALAKLDTANPSSSGQGHRQATDEQD